MNTKFDWESIHRKLSETGKIIKEGFEMSVDEAETILRKRAELFAQNEEKTKAEREVLNGIEFKLNNENYFLHIQYIKEICPVKNCAPLPCVPSYIFGIQSIRGQIYSILNLRSLFEMSDVQITEKSRTILLENEDMAFGILTDEVVKVGILFKDQLMTEISSLNGYRKKYFMGITSEGMIVLNGTKLLTDSSILVNQESSKDIA